MNNDPYETLGVPRDATKKDIGSAYKNKARKAHPDGGGSTEAFDAIKQAAKVLLDPEKRERFDRDGVVDGDKPDNTTAVAMQRITMFFVQSVQASLNAPNNLQLGQLDLIQGASSYFDLQIQNCHKQIYEVDNQVRQFERALRRLKTKRKVDVIRNMLNHHVSDLKGNILAQKREIAIYDEAKLILKDYTFDPEQIWTQIGGLYR